MKDEKGGVSTLVKLSIVTYGIFFTWMLIGALWPVSHHNYSMELDLHAIMYIGALFNGILLFSIWI